MRFLCCGSRIGQHSYLTIAGDASEPPAGLFLRWFANLFSANSASSISTSASIFAFQVLPTIIFIAAFFALLYYLGVMQVVIRAAAWVMQRVMGASGAESLNVAASIFMGQTEAPLTIRPFLPDLTQFGTDDHDDQRAWRTFPAAIMAAYIAFGVEAKHLLTAVIMTAPGTLLIAKMLVPETEPPKTAGNVNMEHGERDAEFSGAIARGTIDGLHLAMNVGAMLIAFLALIALLNGIMGGVHNWLAAHGMHAGFRRACSRFSAGSLRRWRGSSAFRGTIARASAICWACAWC